MRQLTKVPREDGVYRIRIVTFAKEKERDRERKREGGKREEKKRALRYLRTFISQKTINTTTVFAITDKRIIISDPSEINH